MINALLDIQEWRQFVWFPSIRQSFGMEASLKRYQANTNLAHSFESGKPSDDTDRLNTRVHFTSFPSPNSNPMLLDLIT